MKSSKNQTLKKKYHSIGIFKVLFLLVALFSVSTVYANRSSFDGVLGGVWLDVDGKPIQAHGGQVQKIGDKWWWIGEDKEDGYRTQNGISLYSSDDLYNWKFEGYVMRAIKTREEMDTDPYFMALYGDLSEAGKDSVYLAINTTKSVIERPKMIHNEATGKYIIWFHADGPTETADSNYAAAAAGVAVADEITGPYKFIKRSRLHQLPDDEYSQPNQWYEEPGNRGFARDMNLFIDDDKTAYIIYSSEENRTMFISRLNDEYTDLDVSQTPVGLAKNGEDFIRLHPGRQREAPAMFKYDGKYYMITSGATGWDPNKAEYWVADEIFGEWTIMGDPCVSGDDDLYPSNLTFRTQSTNVIPVDAANGKFIYMGDRWNSGNLGDSRYVWLPVIITATGEIQLYATETWDLGFLDVKYDQSQFDKVYFSNATLPTVLDAQVLGTGGWESKQIPIAWDKDIDELPYAALTKMNGNFTVNDGVQSKVVRGVNIPEGLVYFIDCGATTRSALHDSIMSKGLAPHLINKTEYDKSFTEERGWGYLGSRGVDMARVNTADPDALKTGWAALENKTIDYKMKIENAVYCLTAGFQEWENTSRNMSITISYQNDKGEESSKVLGTFTNTTESAQDYTFTIDDLNQANPYLSVSIKRNGASGADPIISWLALTSLNLMGDSYEPPMADSGKLMVYPNPARQSQFVSVELDGNSGLQNTGEIISIYNTLGQCVKQQEVSGERTSVYVSFPSGIYIIKMGDKKEVKLVVK